jgi:hypothetical protein
MLSSLLCGFLWSHFWNLINTLSVWQYSVLNLNHNSEELSGLFSRAYVECRNNLSLSKLWGTASTTNIVILERFQFKALRMIVDAPWYVQNAVMRRDLLIPKVKDEILRYRSQNRVSLNTHASDLIVKLMELSDNRRLRRHLPNDLPTRFLV